MLIGGLHKKKVYLIDKRAMKTLRILFTCCFMLAAVQMMQAQVDVLFVDPVSIEPGGTAEIVVRMDYETNREINSYYFRLSLPEGLLPNTKKENWKPSCVVLSKDIHPIPDDEDVHDYTNYALNIKVEDGSIRFLYIEPETPRSPLVSTHGELMRISIKATADFVSGVGKLYDIHFASDSSVAIEPNTIAEVVFGINEDISPVTSVVNDAPTDNPVYTLQGVRTNGVKKGLYISNGKKYVR